MTPGRRRIRIARDIQLEPFGADMEFVEVRRLKLAHQFLNVMIHGGVGLAHSFNPAALRSLRQ